ncbi:hypothetical protein BGZ95_002233 [Linnemannia exigua]|uniref:Uncharacterized protein n=1 Tax=Linnemannia exigua TaxID=604196 RepID=A0AAD4D6C3_9FUNG|nr:hypothetical protein BGZ95_002233 [Linnemannia exigua]
MTERAGKQVADDTTTTTTTAATGTVTTGKLSSTPSKDSELKKPPGSGPVAISMDVYHQLQQKRLLERQQQESLKQQQQQQQSQGQETVAHHINQDSLPVKSYEHQQPGNQPLETLEQIVSIVQATAPALPIVSTQHHQIPMPGPDLANIIFGTAPAAAAAPLGVSAETDNGVGTVKSAAAATSNGPAGASGNSNHQHRKGASGASGTQIQSQSQPRTSSPPTPASGSSSGAQKASATKGPKAIHAIELIRIAGEILQFPPATIGTSLVYYHKYRAYLHQAYKRGERDNEAFRADEYLFATACLHLACKCTEVSRKVRDLVNVTYRVMNPGQPALSLSTKVNDTSSADLSSSSSSQPQQQNTHSIAPPPTAATYWHIRDSLLTTELMLLRILQFDLDVSLPFSDVLRIYKGMGMVFSPTDEEAANLYPYASNFDVFLPAAQHQEQHHQPSHSSSSPPSKHGAPVMPSSSTGSTMSSPLPHAGIHPTLAALVHISTTFCIDALCSSNIALNSSSRALAMGSIYLAIRSAGLDLPLPFEEWCYAWGRPMIATGFGIQVAGTSGPGGVGMINPGVGAGVSGVNGIMGLTSGTNNLFGLELTSSQSSIGNSNGGPGSGGGGSNGGLNGHISRDPVYSQTHSPLLNSNTNTSQASSSSPSVRAAGDSSLHGSQDSSIPQQPMTIVDEVRKVVQELGSFYTH